MIDTYFFIDVTVNQDEVRFGPYLDLESAAIVLADHVEHFLAATKLSSLDYVACINEYAIYDKAWELIHTHLKEHRMRPGP